MLWCEGFPARRKFQWQLSRRRKLLRKLRINIHVGKYLCFGRTGPQPQKENPRKINSPVVSVVEFPLDLFEKKCICKYEEAPKTLQAYPTLWGEAWRGFRSQPRNESGPRPQEKEFEKRLPQGRRFFVLGFVHLNILEIIFRKGIKSIWQLEMMR